MIIGETVSSGAPATCDECGLTPAFRVCRSAAGYYIGTQCECGPYSRESDYFETEEVAEKELAMWQSSLGKITPKIRS